MTLISRKKIPNYLYLLTLVIFVILAPLRVGAQEALTLSISPSLFDMSANPGQEWQSSLRVINVNKFDLTIYVDVVNFLPQGEGGNGTFVPISAGEGDGSTIAEWFKISKEPIVIPQEQSLDIPLAVNVPFEATPGGHFAAILVGTKPITSEPGEAKVQTSQMVTSLFFARVAGDIKELGSIREFRTTATYLNSPEATFELRFENKGNVHLKPQGDIRITNMWGQERGVVPINQNSNFGNVLPESIRKFTFTWRSEWSISDIGRYTAVATLAYGENGRQFSSSKTNFWIIPYKLIFGIILGLGIFITLATWLIKLYVSKMLLLAGINVNEISNLKKNNTLNHRYRQRPKVKLHLPVQAGIADLKQRLLFTTSITSRLKVLFKFILQYKLFFVAVILLLAFIVVIVLYLTNANKTYRGFEIVYQNPDANVTLTSEEIIYNQISQEKVIEKIKVNPILPKVRIVNRSGEPGLGAQMKFKLEAQAYEVVSLEADFSSTQARTVVIYALSNENDALRLSSRLNNALVSIYEGEKSIDNVLTVYVGGDNSVE